jgi:nucleosome assembly protein 1-like 1
MKSSIFAPVIGCSANQFAARYAPLYSRRSDIITGKAEPTDEEVAAGEAADSDEEEEDDEARVTELDESAQNADDIKGIPQFWLTALKNHAIIGDQITEKDEEVSRFFCLCDGTPPSTADRLPDGIQALKHLIDIRLEYLESKQAGFKLLFVFEANEFFEDTVLEKTYYYQVGVADIGT